MPVAPLIELARRLVPEASRVAVRWCAAADAVPWPAVAVFWLLTPLAAFRLPVLLAAATTLTALTALRLLCAASGQLAGVTPLVWLVGDLRAAPRFLGSLGRLELGLGARSLLWRCCAGCGR